MLRSEIFGLDEDGDSVSLGFIVFDKGKVFGIPSSIGGSSKALKSMLKHEIIGSEEIVRSSDGKQFVKLLSDEFKSAYLRATKASNV